MNETHTEITLTPDQINALIADGGTFNGAGETSPEETTVSEDGVFHVTEDDASHTVTVH